MITGFLVQMFAAAIGLTTLFLAAPVAYAVLKWSGAIYLLYLAWQAVKPGAHLPFEAGQLPDDSTLKLFLMGFLPHVLNPKIAVFYLSIFPQFVSPNHGSVFTRSITLGFAQIGVSFTINLMIAMSAANLARWFSRNYHSDNCFSASLPIVSAAAGPVG